MPSPSYAQNKKFIYNWRHNPENYERHKLSNRISMKKKADWIKIKTIFLHILLV